MESNRSSKEPPEVGIVIPAYNGGQDLERCLKSLVACGYSRLSIVVVDNASSDQSVQLVRECFPRVHVVELGNNTGFAGACNRGVAELTRQGVPYVALVNQDVEVSQGWLEPLVSELESRADVAAVQPLILLADNTTIVNTLGNHIHYLGFGYAGGNGLSIADTRVQRVLRSPSEVTYASGAAVVLRMAHVQELGLFQDAFFMYHEDLDFGWRARLAGYRSLLVPSSLVYHRYDFHRSTLVKYEYGERNRLLVLLENYHVLTLLLIFPAWLVMEVGVVTVSVIRGWLPAKLRGYHYIIKELPTILRVRREHQRLRRCPEHWVVREFAGGIHFQKRKPFLLRALNPFLEAYWAIVRRCIVW